MVVSCEEVWREISNYLEGEVDASLRAAMENLLADSGRPEQMLSGLPWITAYEVHTGHVSDFLASE